MNKNELIEELRKINIDCSLEDILKLECYKELLKEHNAKFNLTAIINDEDIYLKHFYDSLYISTLKEFSESNNILDIGVGAGFPSIPLAITNPNKKFTLIESNQKKCSFLNIVKENLNLTNIEIINERAEDYVRKNNEKYDLCTSRAVSNLKVLLELETPALKINGYFTALKGYIDEELETSNNLIKTLGLKNIQIINYKLPKENSTRNIIILQKKCKTDKKYPRDYAKIIKDLKKK